MTQSAEELYDARVKRFHDAVSLTRPDRVPIVSAGAYFFYKFAGITFKEGMYDYEKSADALKTAMEKFQWDMAPSVALPSGPLMELFGLTQYKWPGYDLPDESFFQFIEGEYMSGEEYGELLANPEGFTVRKLMPRLSRLLEPFAELPPAHWLANGNALSMAFARLAGDPSFAPILDVLQKAGAEMIKYNEARAKFVKDMKDEGFPMLAAPHSNSPYDFITDFLRGMRGIMLDMYRHPNQLLAAIDLFTPMMIENALSFYKNSGNPRVFMPLHRGAGGFMSNEQFAKFYWPSLKKIFLALIDAGLTPMPFFEGDYTPRLEFLTELPKGKVLGNFHVVDLTKFKEILGETMCFRGNVPPSLLIAGTPQKVKDYVKMLIDMFADNGGLVIDGGSGIPYESKVENVEAMTEAVFDYGVFK
jgi:uroporphyrinogen-III decarboxylase